MAMLDRGATAQPIEYTDPGDPRNNWWHHRNPKCRIVASIATFAASLILLVVSFAVNSTSMQQVQLPAAGMCAFSGLSLAIWLYRQYCVRRELHEHLQAPRNAYVPNAGAYRPNPNADLPQVRHGMPLPQVPVGGQYVYSYGSYDADVQAAHASQQQYLPPPASAPAYAPPQTHY